MIAFYENTKIGKKFNEIMSPKREMVCNSVTAEGPSPVKNAEIGVILPDGMSFDPSSA